MKNNENTPKKLKYKDKVSQPKTEPAKEKTAEFISKEFSTKKIYALIIAFTFLLYGNTLFNDFVLDDGIVITKNDFTKKGIAGIADIFKYDTFAGEHGTDVKLVAGGRYRPFTVAMFAIEYELFGENPAFFHFFRRSPSHSGMLSGLPVLLNKNQDAGVYGAALFGAQRLRRRG